MTMCVATQNACVSTCTVSVLLCVLMHKCVLMHMWAQWPMADANTDTKVSDSEALCADAHAAYGLWLMPLLSGLRCYAPVCANAHVCADAHVGTMANG